MGVAAVPEKLSLQSVVKSFRGDWLWDAQRGSKQDRRRAFDNWGRINKARSSLGLTRNVVTL